MNPECKITDAEKTLGNAQVISGYENSTAQAYADTYGRTFEAFKCEYQFEKMRVEPTCTEDGSEKEVCSIGR